MKETGKLIRDFGIDLETFNLEAFHAVANTICEMFKDQTETGISFFMCMNREVLLGIGGMDNLFSPMFCEDDDLVNRWLMLGMKTVTSLDALCYHFVSKTSRFSEEYQKRTRDIEYHSNLNYIRKWGTKARGGDIKKYNIGLAIEGVPDGKGGFHCVRTLEPYVSNLYVDSESSIKDFIEEEQKHTKYDLSERVSLLPISMDKMNDTLVTAKYEDFTKDVNGNLKFIQHLPNILSDSGEVGEMEYGCFKLNIRKLNTYEDKLINL